jgi:hypothetical protein
LPPTKPWTINLAADNPAKTKEYGRQIPLQEFTHLESLPPADPAAAAATPQAQEATPAMIAKIYETTDGYIDEDILNMQMSLDIFGRSTTEIIRINKKHPTLGFDFRSAKGSARPPHYQAVHHRHTRSKSKELAQPLPTWHTTRYRRRVHGDY